MSAEQRAATDHQCLETYRQNLLLDADNPIFYSPLFRSVDNKPTRKLDYLARKNSEDAVTWSVFRLLDLHFGDVPWLEGLLEIAGCSIPAAVRPEVSFWEELDPPQSRLLWLLDHLSDPRVSNSRSAKARAAKYRRLTLETDFARARVRLGKIRAPKYWWVLERATQVDVVLRVRGWLVTVEAKYGSDIDTAREWDNERDQIARTVDAGLELATREGCDSAFLLVTDAKHHPRPLEYEVLMNHYRETQSLPIASNRLGWITWSEIYDWLQECHEQFTPDQRDWLTKLRQYLLARKLISTRA